MDLAKLVFKHVQYDYNAFPKVEIGNRNSLCRFCQSSEVKFNKKRAHSFPEYLGNKSVFTLNECDECNSKFAKIEKDLSNFIPPTFITRLKGKKSYRPSCLKGGEQLYGDDEFITLVRDKMSDGNTLNISSQSFDMLKVYKALLKCLVSILPDENLNEFKSVIEWLKSRHDFEKLNHCPVFWYGYRIPDISLSIKMEIEVTREISGDHTIYLLYGQFNNFFIYFPFSPTSKLAYKANQLPPKSMIDEIHIKAIDCRNKTAKHQFEIKLALGKPVITSVEQLRIEDLNNILLKKSGKV